MPIIDLGTISIGTSRIAPISVLTRHNCLSDIQDCNSVENTGHLDEVLLEVRINSSWNGQHVDLVVILISERLEASVEVSRWVKIAYPVRILSVSTIGTT